MRLTAKVLSLVVTLLALTGCATNNMSRPINGTEFTAFKPDMQTLSEMDRSVVGDRELLAYLNGILKKLNAQLPEPCACTVIVDTHSGYEAFTLSSKTIVLSAGLVAQADTEDELAAIIAHELSHVVHKDMEGTKLREGFAYLARVGDLATGGGGSLLFGDAIEAAAQGLIYNRWDSEEELRADKFAIQLLASAGYSQTGLKMASRRLVAYSEDALASESVGPKCITGGFHKQDIKIIPRATVLTGEDYTVSVVEEQRRNLAAGD